MKTAENLWAPIQEYMFPPVYDIVNDPGEQNNLMKLGLFSYSWVYGPMAKLLGEKAVSMKEYPNIQPGQDFEGYE